MLHGQRIFLGPLTPDDAVIMFRWSNDPDLVHLNAAYRPVDWMNHHGWFQGIGNDPSKVIFAIRRIAESRFVGFVELRSIHPVFRSAEIGLQIGEVADRRQGFGAEALELALRYCWNDLNLERVSLSVFGDNLPAIRLYEKAGFQHEGTLRGAVYVDGRRVDLKIMATLRQ